MQHIQEFCGERTLSVNLNLKIKAAYMGEVHYPAMQDRLPAKLCKITGLKRKHTVVFNSAFCVLYMDTDTRSLKRGDSSGMQF